MVSPEISSAKVTAKYTKERTQQHLQRHRVSSVPKGETNSQSSEEPKILPFDSFDHEHQACKLRPQSNLLTPHSPTPEFIPPDN